ncbi:MAG: rRNA maturation RNase YbeY [Bacteroidia bacterium]
MRAAPLSPVIRFWYAPSVQPWRLRAANWHRAWLRLLWQRYAERAPLQRMDYIFVSSEEIATLHRAFLGVATPTDILTFDYGKEAELYIAPAQVRRQAQWYQVDFAQELRRVLAHGLLHLAGWTDSTPQERRRMRRAENRCLKFWDQLRFT